MPMLPPTWTVMPACFSTQPIRAVVVDLPLVPVTATTFGRSPSGSAASARANSSMSPMTSIPASRALSTVQCGLGWVRGAPGDRTRAAKPEQSAAVRSSTAKPSASACMRLETLSSHSTGRAPPALWARAAVSPDLPRPKTAILRPSKPGTGIMALSQLHGGEAGEGQHGRDDPEADHHRRLRPAHLLEVVVDRGHQEDALAGGLEVGDLDHHRGRLDHEQAADDAQHQLVLGGHGDGAERAAEGQRAGVAHEDLGRRGVVPEEADAAADEGGAEDGQFPPARHVMS